ncbi:MAG: hypothetical protein SFU56_19025 [Capsulimonadales bacterium]|nr:hypothetical protein [Capsulimonadales bacterium]
MSERLWTPDRGNSGLLVLPAPRPLLAVVGTRVLTVAPGAPDGVTAILNGIRRTGGWIGPLTEAGSEPEWHSRPGRGRENVPGNTGRFRQVTLPGLVIVSNARQKEPTRIVGHPDLASGASVQRGNTLYVSVTEAIYRESRGEPVDIRLHPTEDDREALADLRARARHRWENDRLPDGWTRPLPPQSEPPLVASKERFADTMPDDLRELAERIRAKTEETR